MSSPSIPANTPEAGRAVLWWKIACVLVLGGLTAFGFFGMQSVNQHGGAGISMELPALIGTFRGTTQAVSDAEKVVLPADTEFSKMLYKNADDVPVNVQIVLAGAEKRSIHRPEVCLPAQGWTIISRGVVRVPLANGQSLEVMQLVLSRPIEVRAGDIRTLNSVFLYWFVGDRVTTPSHVMRLFLTSWDRVVHRKNHRWAYVIASAPVLKGLAPQGLDLPETESLLKGFVGELAPKIMLNKKDAP
ncbi:MAG: exosortase C-terminal domain/associated protein EpsI [Verrucomicrobiae bacterium]